MMDNAGPDGAIFFNIVGCCEYKVVRFVQFTGQKATSQKPNEICNKTLRLALSTLKTVDLEYCSVLLVVWMVRFWSKSLHNSIIHKRPLIQGSLFLLAVYTHEVPLYLCSIFCSCSQVRLSTASYRVWSVDYTPFCIP